MGSLHSHSSVQWGRTWACPTTWNIPSLSFSGCAPQYAVTYVLCFSLWSPRWFRPTHWQFQDFLTRVCLGIMRVSFKHDSDCDFQLRAPGPGREMVLLRVHAQSALLGCQSERDLNLISCMKSRCLSPLSCHSYPQVGACKSTCFSHGRSGSWALATVVPQPQYTNNI